jgi:hypothetical protein
MATTVKITELPIATTVDDSAVFIVNDTSTNTTKQISKRNLFTQLELDIENYLTDGVRSVVPNLNDTYDLGSSVKRWRDVYVSGDIVAATFTGDGSGLTNLPVSAVGGSAVLGVTPSSVNSNHSVLFTLTNSGTDSVNTDPGLLYNPSTNTLTSGSFVGSAAGMTNRVDSDGIKSLLSTGVNTILPAADSAYDLGSASKKWKDLYLSGSTIYIGGQTISIDGSGNLKFNDSDVNVGTAASLVGVTDGFNTSLGVDASAALTQSALQTAIGYDALSSNETGARNTALGAGAGNQVFNGVRNTLIGLDAGDNITTGSNCIVIGGFATASSASALNEVTLGDTNITSLRCNVTSISSLSDQRDKTDIVESPYGLETLEKIKPRQFVWNTRKGNIKDGKTDIGFIAQELLEAGDNNVLKLVMDNNPEYLEASPTNLIPILVKAVQELAARVKLLESA